MNEVINPKNNKPYSQEELATAFYNKKTVKFILAIDKKAGPIYANGEVDKQYFKDADGHLSERYIVA